MNTKLFVSAANSTLVGTVITISHVADIFPIIVTWKKKLIGTEHKRKDPNYDQLYFTLKKKQQTKRSCETACYERFHNKRKLNHTHYPNINNGSVTNHARYTLDVVSKI